MNTLNKEITKDFYDNIDGYEALRRRWSELMNDRDLRKSLRCEHHLLYLMLRGKNWHQALTFTTNPNKLANGADAGWVGRRVISMIHFAASPFALERRWGTITHCFSPEDAAALLAPFNGIVSPAGLERLRDRLPVYGWNDAPLSKEPYGD